MDDREKRQGEGRQRPARGPARGSARGTAGPRRPARPPAPPAPAPAPAPIDDATAASLVRLVGTFVALLLAALATTTLPLPLRVGSMVFTVAAIVVGARALVLTRRTTAREQLSLVLMFGIAFSVLTGMSMLGTFILWPVEMAHQECLSRAVTIGATDRCERIYEDAVQARLDGLIHRP